MTLLVEMEVVLMLVLGKMQKSQQSQGALHHLKCSTSSFDQNLMTPSQASATMLGTYPTDG